MRFPSQDDGRRRPLRPEILKAQGRLCRREGSCPGLPAYFLLTNTPQKEIQQPGKQGSATGSDSSDDGSSDDSAKRSIATYTLMRRYVTSGGREVELDGEGNVGRSIFQVVARNETLHEEQINGHVFDPDEEGDEFAYMEDNLDVVEETIVKLL